MVLSQEEVLLESVPNIKPRTILTTCYATGLRITEAVHLEAWRHLSAWSFASNKGKRQKEGSVRDAYRLKIPCFEAHVRA